MINFRRRTSPPTQHLFAGCRTEIAEQVTQGLWYMAFLRRLDLLPLPGSIWTGRVVEGRECSSSRLVMEIQIVV